MLNAIVKSIGVIVVSTLAATTVSESIQVIKKYKEIRKEYQDMKTLDAIKQAAADRVAEIKADPRKIIIPMYGAFVAVTGYVVGHWEGVVSGFRAGFEEGIWQGVHEGVINLQNMFWDSVPKEYRKYLNIIKSTVGETEIFRHKYNSGKSERWYTWDPARAIKDHDDYVSSKEQEVKA